MAGGGARYSRVMPVSRLTVPARLALIAAGVALVAAACGGSSDVGVSSRPHQEVTTTSSTPDSTTSTSVPVTTVPTTPTTAAAAPGMQFVTYGGVRLQVPDSWPVYDLTNDPKRCALLNVNAAFLGHQGTNATCPADATGRTEVVQIEAVDARSQSQTASATQPGTLNGIAVKTDPSSSIHRALTVVIPDRSVVVSITYRNDPTLANAIMQSIEHAS
jgi:hypothetical protein